MIPATVTSRGLGGNCSGPGSGTRKSPCRASSTFLRAEKYNNGNLYAVWQVSPTLQTELAADYLRSSGDSSAKYFDIGVGADYNISKRTDFYAVAAYGHASGQNGLGTAQAVIGSTDADSGKNNQSTIVIGMRHKF